VLSTVAGDSVLVTITDSSNNSVGGGYVDLNGASRADVCPVKARVTGISGSVTYKVRCQRNAGTGNVAVVAGTGRPAYFTVKDVGAN
jgi:hypothetical protein